MVDIAIAAQPHASMAVIIVKAAYDAGAGVWFVESSDAQGLNLEAATMEQLRDKLQGAILDLLELSDGGGQVIDLPVELIAHASTRVTSGMAA